MGENLQRFADREQMIRNDQQVPRERQVTKALQISKGPPCWSCTVKGETTDCISLSLTLPK